MVKHLPTMRETWVQSLGRKDLLEKEMATYSSILAWRIPWTEEPDELQSMGLVTWGYPCVLGFPGGSDSKESAGNAGDLSLILRSGRSPGEGNGNLFQYSCLENSMDRKAWWASVPGSQRVNMT